MKSFIIRALSAVIAVVGVFALYFFLGVQGLKVLVAIATIAGSIELIRLFFQTYASAFLKALFYALTFVVFIVSSTNPAFAGLSLALAFIVTSICAMQSHPSGAELVQLRNFCAKSALGYIYLGLFPSFAWRLLERPNGTWWLITLMAVVFTGDIGAYVFGTLWGKTKILSQLSPKKSLQGSLGGIFGSILAILACLQFTSYAQWQYFVALAIVTAFVAQMGDFFESLLKRVADLKDSGNFMPGHGGILDRIDGVLFAAPLFYFISLFIDGNF